jgi:hypothetical protein
MIVRAFPLLMGERFKVLSSRSGELLLVLKIMSDRRH